MIGFFPRHILVGCIGGVGYFLFITGLGVSSGLGETVPYTLATLKYLLQPAVLVQWLTPLALAGALVLFCTTTTVPILFLLTLLASFYFPFYYLGHPRILT